MKTKNIANKLIEGFSFLQHEYGFTLASSDIKKEYCIVKMKNSTTGISLQYEVMEDDIIVYLHRLLDGEIVEDKYPLSVDIPLNAIELRFIIQFKQGVNYISKFKSSSSESYDQLIADTANDLKKYADDILNGDFEVFDKVGAIAKKRRLEWQNS